MMSKKYAGTVRIFSATAFERTNSRLTEKCRRRSLRSPQALRLCFVVSLKISPRATGSGVKVNIIIHSDDMPYHR